PRQAHHNPSLPTARPWHRGLSRGLRPSAPGGHTERGRCVRRNHEGHCWLLWESSCNLVWRKTFIELGLSLYHTTQSEGSARPLLGGKFQILRGGATVEKLHDLMNQACGISSFEGVPGISEDFDKGT